jgi:hypothetical protein
MRLYIVVWHHRHGVDVLPAWLDEEEKPPEITNDLLADLGAGNPELVEDGEEWAEWRSTFTIPTIKNGKVVKTSNGHQ